MSESELDPLFDMLNAVAGAKKEDPKRETRDAMRKYQARQQQELYRRAVEETGEDMRYASAGHLVSAVLSGTRELAPGLKQAVSAFSDSELMSEIIEHEFKGVNNVKELLVAKVENMTPEQIDKLLNMEFIADYTDTLFKYCQETEQSPYDIIRNPESMLRVKGAYHGNGLRDNLEKRLESGKTVLESTKDIPNRGQMTMMVKMKYSSELDKETRDMIEKAGIEPEVVISAAMDYMEDVQNFAKAYVTAGRDMASEEICLAKEMDLI